jgi:hypothetical protein
MSPFCLRIASTSQGYPFYPADNPTHPNTKMASDKTPGLSGMAIWEPMRFTQTKHYFIWWRMRKKRLFLGKIITSNRSTPATGHCPTHQETRPFPTGTSELPVSARTSLTTKTSGFQHR